MKIIVILPNREEFVCCEVIKGLYRRGVELIPSSPLSTIRNSYKVGSDDIPNIREYSDDEIIEHSKSADYIFVFWSKFGSPYDKTPGGRMYLVDKINEPDKTVFIDGSEWSYTGHKVPSQLRKDKWNCTKGMPWIWQEMRDKVKWYFKRETFTDDIIEHNIIPCPYPFRIEDTQSILDKDISLFTVFGHTTTGLRYEVEQASKDISHDLPVITGQQPGGREHYLNLLCRSYLVADAWGGGDCTVRRCEAHMNSTALIMQRWNTIEPYEFTDGENIILYDSTDEFVEKVNFYLKDLDKLVEIGVNGYKHSLKYHTTEKRVQYIFDILEGKISWADD
jgi:hypothetical protein|tara:strand:+ start:864 stop:1868 length:1005 start_codon:yes stop_codon:yes gene_type:complete